MKCKIISHILGLAILILVTGKVNAQDNSAANRSTNMDTVQSIEVLTPSSTQGETTAAERLDELKRRSNEAEAAAKQAELEYKEAKNSAKEAKKALKAEQRAQQSRKDANKQARQAEDARRRMQ